VLVSEQAFADAVALKAALDGVSAH